MSEASTSASFEQHSNPHLPSSNAKRKREGDGEQLSSAIRRKIEQKRSRKASRNGHDSLDLESGINLAVGRLNSQLMADYVAQSTKHLNPDMSLVELEDRHISGTYRLFTSDHSL